MTAAVSTTASAVQTSEVTSLPVAARPSSNNPKSASDHADFNHTDSSSVIEIENYLLSTLNLSNRLSKHEKIDNQEVALAKMLNYCIRMLHADGWHPPTVVRAMALRESGLDQSMKGTLYKAMRDRRSEMDANRMVKKGDADKVLVKDGGKSRVTSDGSNISGRPKVEKDGAVEEVLGRKTSQIPGQGPHGQKRRVSNRKARKASGRKSSGSEDSHGSPAPVEGEAKIAGAPNGKGATGDSGQHE